MNKQEAAAKLDELRKEIYDRYEQIGQLCDEHNLSFYDDGPAGWGSGISYLNKRNFIEGHNNYDYNETELDFDDPVAVQAWLDEHTDEYDEYTWGWQSSSVC